MKMDETDGDSVADSEESGNLSRVHRAQSFRRQGFRPDRKGVGRHHGRCFARHEFGAHVPPQVAVRNDADKGACGVHDSSASQPARRDDNQNFRHSIVRPDQRHGIARMHDVGHPHQPAAKLAPGMKNLEIVGRKTAAFQKRDRNCIAQRQRHGRRCRRRQPVRAGLG